MVTRDEKEKQWFWMMPELRQEMKMVATRRRMTLDAAYNEAVQEWIHPAMQDEALGEPRSSSGSGWTVVARTGIWPLPRRQILDRHSMTSCVGAESRLH